MQCDFRFSFKIELKILGEINKNGMELGLISKTKNIFKNRKEIKLISHNKRSTEWNSVSDKNKKELGLVVDNDGEFW